MYSEQFAARKTNAIVYLACRTVTWLNLIKTFFQYAEYTREEVCYTLHREQVLVKPCISCKWNAFLDHMLSSCCSHSWVNPFSSSISLLLGQLHLLLEFVSHLQVSCSAKPFTILPCLLNLLPVKKRYILIGKLLKGWRSEWRYLYYKTEALTSFARFRKCGEGSVKWLLLQLYALL